MTRALSQGEIAAAFLAACEAELNALKPGNVHKYADGHRMKVADFERSAAVAAPHIANSRLRAGARIRRAVEATVEAVGCNTNLGIVLLSVPLAMAAARSDEPLRSGVERVLADLDRTDAGHAFAAISRANPAGLGQAQEADVSGPARVTLLEAMRLAKRRDRIARAYATGYADIFDFGLKRLRRARAAAGWHEDAVTSLHMAYMMRFADSHIWRKHGRGAALAVKYMARDLGRCAEPPIGPKARNALIDFDRRIKSEGLNPGTTADLVVATLFAEAIIALRDVPASR